MQWMQGYVMLEVDYFADNPIITPKEFWQLFMMNKELFMLIVMCVREYDDYFFLKKFAI
jgi:hypothetical protein